MSRYAAADVLAKTDRFFAFTEGSIPVLRDGVKACGCGSDRWVPRFWKKHLRNRSATTTHRCDVGVKCEDCGVLARHGVVITRDRFEALRFPTGKQVDHHDLTAVEQEAVRVCR